MRYSYQYYKMVFHGRQMPFAFVDLDLLKANIRQTIARAGTKRIRLASKSIRAVALIEKILAANPAFQGLMCFTAPEAVWLSRRGLDDLLLGYPCWHAEQVRMICAEVRRGCTSASGDRACGQATMRCARSRRSSAASTYGSTA